MTNLTPSEARRLIEKLHHNQTKEHGISILEEKYLDALVKALPVLDGKVQAIPDGWKLVPIEPTTEMVWAGKEELSSTVGWESFKQAYKAMVNASPSQSTTDTYRQIENDGWIEWRGDCDPDFEPVAGAAKVEVKFRNGKSCVDEARMLYWKHLGGGADIIAYRVIENDGREG